MQVKVPLHSHFCLLNEFFVYNSYCPKSIRDVTEKKKKDHIRALVIILDESGIKKDKICSPIAL